MFENMVNSLTADRVSKVRVTEAEWQEFQRQMIFEILADRRLGQAFCDRFNIGTASPLYFFKDDRVSERWIRDNYLEQSHQ